MTPEPELVIADKYRLVRALAKGGMGTIWVAEHLDLEVEVAVKLMSETVAASDLGRKRFRREARAAAKLKSPHVTQIHDYGVFDDTPYMVMELLDGEDLQGYLDRKGQLSLERCAEIIRPVCLGLTLAHAAGIVHRDLKPSNVFLSMSGSQEVVKILDFGIAKQTAPELPSEGTASGVLVGSPRYMSPEQAQGLSIDHRSDIWSLGVMLYKMLTGRTPFAGENFGQLVTALLMCDFALATTVVSTLAPEVDELFGRVLAHDVENRLDSAMAFSLAVDALAQGNKPGFEAPDSAPRSDGPPPKSARAREEATVASDDEIAKTAAAATKEVPRTDGTSPGVGIDSDNKAMPSIRTKWAVAVIGVGLAAVWVSRDQGPTSVAPSAVSSAASSAVSTGAGPTGAGPTGAGPTGAGPTGAGPAGAALTTGAAPVVPSPPATSRLGSPTPQASMSASATAAPRMPASSAPFVVPRRPKTSQPRAANSVDDVFGIPTDD